MRTFRQLIPLLAAVLALQLIFRFGLPYVWWDGQGLLHWWPGISGFWEQGNQIDIVQQISINAILAFGMTLTILIGGIDLSVGAVLALVGTIAVSILAGGKAPNSGSLAMGLLAGLGAAIALGLFNGLCAAKTRMPAFIITLATMLIARGAAMRFNEGRPIHVPDGETIFLGLGNGRRLYHHGNCRGWPLQCLGTVRHPCHGDHRRKDRRKEHGRYDTAPRIYRGESQTTRNGQHE